MTDIKEAFYDSEIAPHLAELALKCQQNGLSFLAVVEFGPGDTGRTRALVDGFSDSIAWADVAAQCDGNADALIFALMKQAQERGHQSACLKRLGVPHEPTDPKEMMK